MVKNKLVDYLSIGDKVYDILKGWGVVNCLNETEYQIGVSFNNEIDDYYLSDGRSFIEDVIPSLYLEEPKITLPELPKFKKGDLVWVENSDGSWTVRFFSHMSSKYYHCFANQRKLGETCGWSKCRAFDDNPLLEK